MTNIDKLYGQLLEGEVSKEIFVKKARLEYPNFVTQMNSFEDIVTILKNKSIIAEAHKLDTNQIIDRLSPYAVKAGIDFEMSKKQDLVAGDYDKIRKKVAKNLQKNQNYYRDRQHANAKDILKRDEKQDMEPVKSGNLVDKDNKMQKPKGFHADKANTKASKKENRKGKPKGVKIMKEEVQSGGNIPPVADFSGQEVTIAVDPTTRKKYPEPKKVKVTRQEGSLVWVDKGDGQEDPNPVTLNMLNPEPELSKPDLAKAWSDWDKTNQGKLSAGASKDAPGYTTPMEEDDMPKIREIVGKLKDYLKRKKGSKKGVKDEAMEFSIGGKTQYVRDQDAIEKEKELRAAGVTKFGKRRVQ